MPEPGASRRDVVRAGAVLADLTAHVYAWATEGETGASLEQRRKEIAASLASLARLVGCTPPPGP